MRDEPIRFQAFLCRWHRALTGVLAGLAALAVT
jgi:hypothetical protein